MELVIANLSVVPVADYHSGYPGLVAWGVAQPVVAAQITSLRGKVGRFFHMPLRKRSKFILCNWRHQGSDYALKWQWLHQQGWCRGKFWSLHLVLFLFLWLPIAHCDRQMRGGNWWCGTWLGTNWTHCLQTSLGQHHCRLWCQHSQSR